MTTNIVIPSLFNHVIMSVGSKIDNNVISFIVCIYLKNMSHLTAFVLLFYIIPNTGILLPVLYEAR